MDGKLAASKANAAPGELLADLSPNETPERTVSVLVHADKAGKAGIADSLWVENLGPTLTTK